MNPAPAKSSWPFRFSSDRPAQIINPEQVRRNERKEAASRREAGRQEIAQTEDAPF